MLPAYFANMAPVFMKDCCNGLAIPIDNGKNIFGNNKTYRGFLFGMIFALLITFFQFLLSSYSIFRAISLTNYSNWLTLGLLFGFGALFGDLLESFIKRRLKMGPGKRFFPWDQLDFVIGALILVSFSVKLTWVTVLIIVLISVVGHVLVNHAAFYLGIRKEKW
jgi:CDP-2,3-bis-(O-geranylgeranyl)-sn-glycerol synthase